MKRSELIKKLATVRYRIAEKQRAHDTRVNGEFTGPLAKENRDQWHYWLGQMDAIAEVLKLLSNH